MPEGSSNASVLDLTVASAATPAAVPPPVTVVQPSGSAFRLQLGDLWRYRELLYFLVWRDVKVRYKQTALGAAWALLQPLLTMAVFTVFFGRLAKVPSDHLPYPLFAYCALVPWQLFAYSLNEAGNSLVNNQQLIKKVFFPRIIIATAPVFAGLLDFGISSLLLVAMVAYYQVVPGLALLALPAFLLLAIAVSMATGLWVAALNVEYRDVRYVLPFLTQFWLFVTPIAYPSTLVPGKWRALYALNPMATVVECFRWSLGGPGVDARMLLVSCVVVAALLLGGISYFRRVERTVADVV